MQKELYYHDEAKNFSLIKFLACVLGTLLFAFVSSLISKIKIGYSIIVPDWTPGINTSLVGWSILAVLAGWSLYLALQRNCSNQTEKRCRFLYVSLWVIQAVFAFVWPISLLVYNKITFSFVWIAILDGIVAALIIAAFRLRASSGIILIPYFAVLLLATYFNVSVIMLN